MTAGSIRWTGFDESKWSWSELGSTVTTRYEALFAPLFAAASSGWTYSASAT